MKKVNKKQSFPDTSNVRFRGDQMKSMWQVQHKQTEVFFFTWRAIKLWKLHAVKGSKF